MSWSWLRCTVTVVAVPPWAGSTSAGSASRRSVSASPSSLGWGSVRRRPRRRCVGVRRTLRGRSATGAAAASEIRPLSRVVPSPSGLSDSRVRSAASCSSRSRALRSASSLISGATTSRTFRARRRKGVGAKSSARPMRCSSARSRISATRPSVGSSSRAWAMTMAWSRLTRPSRTAAPQVDVVVSRERASWSRPMLGRWSWRVAAAYQSPARAGAVLVGDVAGGGHHRQQQPLGAGHERRQLAHRGGLVACGHEGRVEGGGFVELVGNARDNVQQRVLLCCRGRFPWRNSTPKPMNRNRCSSCPQGKWEGVFLPRWCSRVLSVGSPRICAGTSEPLTKA